MKVIQTEESEKVGTKVISPSTTYCCDKGEWANHERNHHLHSRWHPGPYAASVLHNDDNITRGTACFLI